MINIKSQKEIEAMREGGKILSGIMLEIKKSIATGKNTLELDKLAERLVFESGGTPSFKNYENGYPTPFPATICASINSEVVHGIPANNRIIKNGDLLKIDIGMKYKNMHTDMARTFLVGKVSPEAKKIAEVTEQSFWKGIKKLQEGVMMSEYSKAAQKFIEEQGFSVVKNLVGHGVGKELHEDPIVPNYYYRKYDDFRLVSGMTLALEPMVNAGNSGTKMGKNGWVFLTQDGKNSAHYENTILITKQGVEVLTADNQNNFETKYILGIDYGKAKIGLALADYETKIAFAFKTIKNDKNLFFSLAKIKAEKNINKAVIGIPSYVNKKEVVFEQEKFGKLVEEKLGIPVEYQDEMFTTKMAQQNLIEKGLKGVKKYDDQESARIILTEWINKNNK